METQSTPNDNTEKRLRQAIRDPAPGQALRQALDALPPDARALIVLRDIRGMSYDEIAQTLDLPLGTVKSRISRAREKLSALLQKSSELFSSPSV